MGLKMKNFNILGIDWKIRLLRGEFTKNWYRGWGLPKRGAWTVCRFIGGSWQEKGGGVFEGGGWYPNADYVTSKPFFHFSENQQVAVKLCYIKYETPEQCCIAQHLTNTVFIDKALIVVPINRGKKNH